ncbi:hypothetical protein Scep_012642 [Stephania cephalantha]|uniref:Uncharacterized protein n=1 Tax=Stephania cephalantha TaxID=152367 RepID=A0AAP0JFS8_9MAGN
MDGDHHYQYKTLTINFCKAWITAIASLTYSYYISENIKPDITRLISLLPIIATFTLIPYPSFHPPISAASPPSSLPGSPTSSSSSSSSMSALSPHPPLINHYKTPNKSPLINCALIKFLLFALLHQVYPYRSHLHPNLILALYSLHVYLNTEILLAMSPPRLAPCSRSRSSPSSTSLICPRRCRTSGGAVESDGDRHFEAHCVRSGEVTFGVCNWEEMGFGLCGGGFVCGVRADARIDL